MFTNNKKIPLQRYWTSRFLLTLIIGLAIIAIVSAFWIKHTTLENRLRIMEFMAEETARRIANMDEEELPPGMDMHRFLEGEGKFFDMEGKPSIYVTDTDGTIIYENLREMLENEQIQPSLIDNEEEVQKVSGNDVTGDFYVIKKPIEENETIRGWVFYIEYKEKLAKVDQAYGQLTVMIISLLILGWIAIYILAGRLAKPIKEVANAAKQIEEGDYQIELLNEAKEEEVDTLIQSFKEMAQKLEKLEALRTELLAGVSHELKTPVTSISGLLNAVNDGVVEGDEAKDFLESSIKETEKIKKMVEDLLAFNTFAANAVPVSIDNFLINDLIKESVSLWEKSQGKESATSIEMSLLQDDLEVEVDPVRFQQIMTNLLNNATQAMLENKQIKIAVTSSENKVLIDVMDNGMGIPEADQLYIFERFYRGDNKKHKVGGLGLGLPFSKMIAQVLGGDLVLIKSDQTGTDFRVILPVYSGGGNEVF
ncbi:Signal transduction histidine kinase [Gracilibacillus ureilyticus]|uniref:histidine kinase n=1 Tax=Gracilibacillus ureilyticus TaxID=531814 RepID=A0A1H9QPB8_9BACI|nr:HAMP domain-containing sensor histidine kinase [Gracilibacillus ureilyticus]SER62260.1 Signal transduction histidine kinase [Gracilibacillus ureilyticus]